LAFERLAIRNYSLSFLIQMEASALEVGARTALVREITYPRTSYEVYGPKVNGLS